MDNKENKVQNFKLNIEAEESACLSYFLKHESLLNEKYLTDLTNEFRNAGVKFGEEYEGFVIRFVIHIFNYFFLFFQIGSYNNQSSEVYNHKMKKVDALYKMFCILKNQVQSIYMKQGRFYFGI